MYSSCLSFFIAMAEAPEAEGAIVSFKIRRTEALC